VREHFRNFKEKMINTQSIKGIISRYETLASVSRCDTLYL
jgi:hypothetical protein